ncbi:MAG: imidazoleglycerol-phosphate dehydratase HisB [Rhodothalassiaceae bacterium]
MRQAQHRRKTRETEISVALDLDGTGEAAIGTGIGFLDHMLEQIARHALVDLEVAARGDLHIDAHHTVEDVAITLGGALDRALGDRAGIARFGAAHVAMDEALARVVLDISGRPYLVWNARLTQPRLGEIDSELFEHFFRSLAFTAGLTLHVALLYGRNNHHIIEAIFKAFARALREAAAPDPRRGGAVPSSKGRIGEKR